MTSIHTHARTHAHTHTRARTHTHTHTHAHVCGTRRFQNVMRFHLSQLTKNLHSETITVYQRQEFNFGTHIFRCVRSLAKSAYQLRRVCPSVLQVRKQPLDFHWTNFYTSWEGELLKNRPTTSPVIYLFFSTFCWNRCWCSSLIILHSYPCNGKCLNNLT
jgi:hypothetical protein